MTETKMTNILVATDEFIAILTYPVVSKITHAVGKKSTVIEESVEAVIEITPILHKAPSKTKAIPLAEKFYDIISQDSSKDNSRTKRANLASFIQSCTEREKNEIRESLHFETLESIADKVDTIIVSLLDKNGDLVRTKRSTVTDCEWALARLIATINLPHDGKRPRRPFVAASPVPEHKVKRGNKPMVKEGGTRRYQNFNKRPNR
jgi:hypothetical protein